jgi:hypothetical protein
MISKAMVHLAQAMHLSYAETITLSKCTETSFHLSLITLEYLPVHLKQFLSLWYVWRKLYLSCTETNSISKRTERRFYMTHVT